MGGRWFVSDLHFGHGKVSDLRGFNTTAEHDEAIYNNWLKKIHVHDEVFVLGDIAVSNYEYALNLITGLPGRKHLITGNHDPVFPGHNGWQKHYRRWLEVFETVSPYTKIKIMGQAVMLSHFPYSTSEDQRYLQYRLPDQGQWLIHGHVHSNRKTIGRQVNVCLEAWDMYPAHLSDVEKIIKESTDD